VYFSQPNAHRGPQYVDNPNALFEAGMYYGLCAEEGGITSAWIPVREKDSPECPADFRDELMLVVPRKKNGELNGGELRKLISTRVHAMLARGAGDNDVIKKK
jgi:hypothetical protein